MSIFNYKQRNNIVLVSIIVLGCFLVYALSGLFSSILGAIVLFTIFRPVFIYLSDKKGWNKTMVALLIIFSSLVVIVIPFLSLSFMVIGKIGSINRLTCRYRNGLRKLMFSQVQTFISNILQRIRCKNWVLMPPIFSPQF